MRSIQLIGCIGVLVVLMVGRVCQAVDRDVWFDVSAGGDAIGYPQPKGLDDDQMPPAWALDQHLDGRVNASLFPGPNSELTLQYGLEQRWRFAQDEGSTDLADVLQPGGSDFRYRDLDAELVASDDGDFAVYQNLDRLYGLFYTPAGTVTVGRQAISFGLAKVFSPVDVVLPSGIRAQERSYRPGVDAARWLVPFGAVSELDVGWVVGDDNLAFVRGYSAIDMWTLEATALVLNESNALFGLGTQTAVGSWGLWQELAWLDGDDESGLRWTLGVDQQVFGDVYVVAEYHYNGLGDDGGSYSQLTDPGVFYRKGMVVPWGRHYLSVQASNPLTPLIQGQVGTTVNLLDGSALSTAALDWSVSNNSSVSVGLEWPMGTEPVVEDSVPSVSEEFGVYPSRLTVSWSTVF